MRLEDLVVALREIEESRLRADARAVQGFPPETSSLSLSEILDIFDATPADILEVRTPGYRKHSKVWRSVDRTLAS